MICAGCDVRKPWEHRCFGVSCECAECRDADNLMTLEASANDHCRKCGQARIRFRYSHQEYFGHAFEEPPEVAT